MKCIGVLFVLVIFACCASSQEINKGSLPPAEFIFYRSFIPKMKAPIKKVPIYINDTLVANLKANTIFSTKIFSEGKKRVRIDEKGETSILLTVTSGTTYYFKCEVIPGFWFGLPTIQLVASEIGKAECKTLQNKLSKKNKPAVESYHGSSTN